MDWRNLAVLFLLPAIAYLLTREFSRKDKTEELRAAFPERAAILADAAREETRRTLTAALQAHLDATAQTHGYDGVLSLCSYAGSPHPRFGPEGQAGVEFRDAVWAYGYQVLDECEAGTRPVPTEAELVAGAPGMVWP